MASFNSYEDEKRAEAYARLEFPGTYYLAYRNIPQILSKFANGNIALDFGCGPGSVLAHLLREEGFQVDIYDPFFSPEKVYKNKTYDLITSTEVFEHLKNPVETFKTLYNCLNPEGIIAIMTLYHTKNSEEFQKWWYRRDETHISFYSHNTFRYLAEIFNMKILLLDYKNLCVMQKQAK